MTFDFKGRCLFAVLLMLLRAPLKVVPPPLPSPLDKPPNINCN